MTDKTDQTKDMMRRIASAIAKDGETVETEVVIPAMSYMLGYYLGKTLEPGAPLNMVYAALISDIDKARQTSAVLDEASSLIERVKQ